MQVFFQGQSDRHKWPHPDPQLPGQERQQPHRLCVVAENINFGGSKGTSSAKVDDGGEAAPRSEAWPKADPPANYGGVDDFAVIDDNDDLPLIQEASRMRKDGYVVVQRGWSQTTTSTATNS